MPEQNYADAYAGTTGLKEEFKGKITGAIFTYDSEYNNGNTLIARIDIIDLEDGEEITRKLSTGSGWEDDEKGTKAKREDGGAPKGFNNSCNYQRFVKGAAETDYAEVMFPAGPPWDMTIWSGEPIFRFEIKEFPAFEKGAEPLKVLVPAEFIGFEDTKAKKAPAKKAPAKVEDAEEATEADETPAQKAKRIAAEKKAAKAGGAGDSADVALLKTIAAEAESHEEFMERAYGELEDADALEETITDEGWYTSNH